MELDNLIGEVEAMADKNAELQKRESDLRDEFAAICEGNFEKIVFPYVVKMNKVMHTISDKVNVGVKELRKELLKTGDFEFSITATYYGLVLHYNEFRTYGVSVYLSRDCKGLSFLAWKRLSDYCLSEEKARAFVEELSGYYRTILERFRTVLADKNAELAETIKKLEDSLKDMSAPKENVDGTVEFHLNGKVYIGTVKEEENA